MDSLVISASWLDGIKNALGAVTSSGQATAAIDECLSFADDIASEVGGGILAVLFADPWRSAASKDITDSANQVRAIRGKYESDSETAVGADWPNDKARLLNLYSLAQIVRKGYPADVDATGYEDLLVRALTSLPVVIANAPKAVVAWASGQLGDMADSLVPAVQKIGNVGTQTAKQVGNVAEELAKGAGKVIEAATPWALIVGAVLIGAGAIFGVVYMARNGVKVKVPL